MDKHQEMPCPRCGVMHAVGEFIPRPELATKPLGEVMETASKAYGIPVRSGTPIAPADVNCTCGATLTVTVPFFATDPYGWHWRIL